MKLHVHEQGSGDKLALLIHGGMSDHRTWHALTDELVGRGYRVLAPDLRGHGQSPRGDYTLEAFSADLVENLPAGADVAIGHSLGGLSLSLAIDDLKPQRAVYVDPGFAAPAGGGSEMAGQMMDYVDTATAEAVRQMSPRWSEADVEAEIAGFALFDRASLNGLMHAFAERDLAPASALVPSLVLLADPSLTIDDPLADRLRQVGFDVQVVKGTGHCIHRDDFPAFMAALQGWI